MLGNFPEIQEEFVHNKRRFLPGREIPANTLSKPNFIAQNLNKSIVFGHSMRYKSERI